jgi:hypothetical protein
MSNFTGSQRRELADSLGLHVHGEKTAGETPAPPKLSLNWNLLQCESVPSLGLLL